MGTVKTRIAVVTLLASLGWAASASAKTISVNTTKDLAPKAGDCTGTSRCSLRQAVAKAAPGDTVVVPAASKHYLLKLGAIRITQTVTIRGGGAKHTIIDGNGGDGVFIKTGGSSTNPALLTIEDLTVTGSKATGALFGGRDSGAIVNENYGPMTLRSCVITGNSASPSPTLPPDVAAAVDSEGGALRISHCSITDNHASTSDSSTTAVGAGAIDSEGGPLTVTASNISHNTVTLASVMPIIGGGIVSEGGALKLVSSTVSDNKATATNHTQPSDGAGGVVSEGGAATVENATISGNKIHGSGSFIAGGFLNDGGTGRLVYVTLARNAASAGAADLLSSGVRFAPFGSVFALAPSGQSDCLITGPASSLGHNFADDSSCALNGAHDRTHGNPKLAKLANNGGPGPTEAPLAGSPLIDFIPKAQCAAGIKIDERGRPRPDHGEHACDIGAYEVQDK